LYVHNNVSDAEKYLQSIQDQIQANGHSDQLMNEEKKVQHLQNEAHLKQETFRQEKAKIRWHVNGDRNQIYLLGFVVNLFKNHTNKILDV